ncbi:hypothetical protein C5167_028299 [Papaver somniferum]|nr:hypothetical protein C5167_028299 [Papaver somniferum]
MNLLMTDGNNLRYLEGGNRSDQTRLGVGFSTCRIMVCIPWEMKI